MPVLLQAAVNFGQYSYSGYFPNYPTVSRLPIPEESSTQWQDWTKDPDLGFLQSFSSKETAMQVQ